MLHASETWPLSKPNLQRLQRNDRAMIRQMCGVKAEETSDVRSVSLLEKLGLDDIDTIIRERRLRWYAHVERSTGAIKTARDLVVEGKRGHGRPKLTWREIAERDRKQWNLLAVDPHNKDEWRSEVRQAMRAASQLPG